MPKKRITPKPGHQVKIDDDFINETSAFFVEKKGVLLWQRVSTVLIKQAEPVDDQTVFEMGLRLGWKAAMRLAMNIDKEIPRDDE